MSTMKRDQRGISNILLIPLILVLVLLVALAVYTVIVFQNEQKYKNHSDELVNTAVTNAKQQQQTFDTQQNNLNNEKPLKPYTGPSAYGSIVIYFPKTWSAYVDEEDSSGIPLNGYFQPNIVPSLNNPNNTFALRLKVTTTPYDEVLQQFISQQQNHKVSVTPYTAPKVPSVQGVRIDGEIESNVEGSMVVLPLRNTTLQLWTESSKDEADFNNNILPNFSFSP